MLEENLRAAYILKLHPLAAFRYTRAILNVDSSQGPRWGCYVLALGEVCCLLPIFTRYVPPLF